MYLNEDRLFTTKRLRTYGTALLTIYLVGFAVLLVSQVWPVDAAGHPAFIDFVFLWSAGQLVRAGTGKLAYDYAAISALQAPLVGASKGVFPYFHFPYPPQTLLFVAPLGMFGFAKAFTVWVGGTGALYLLALRRIVPHPMTWFVALLTPCVAMNAYIGQTGLLLAALLGFALVSISARPILGGIFLGLLTYKPQFGVLFPAVLIVSGQWRALFSAVSTTAILLMLTTWAFGTDVWEVYRLAMRGTNTGNFTTDVELTAVIQTVFGVMDFLGAPLAVKWAAHLAVTGAVAALVCVISRRPGRAALKAAALAIGALLATPYMIAYDLIAVSVPAAFIVRDGLQSGFRRGDRLALFGCFLALFASLHLPVGPVILIVMLALVTRRLHSSPDAPPQSPH